VSLHQHPINWELFGDQFLLVLVHQARRKFAQTLMTREKVLKLNRGYDGVDREMPA